MTDLFRFLFFLICHCSGLIVIQAIIFQCKSTDPCGCSRNNVEIDLRIISGEKVAYRSWGWAVSVRNSNDIHLCGGTILSKYYILTAAHCFRKTSEESLPYSVAMGVDSLLSTIGQVRIVSEIFIHPKWNLTDKENDIAILKLNSPISMNDINIAKICLPNVIQTQQVRYPILHSSLVAIGWGITTWEDVMSPMYLRQMTLEVISSTQFKCSNIIKNINLQFCASVNGGGKGNEIDSVEFDYKIISF
jgi:secreted trypsin-like serine protease